MFREPESREFCTSSETTWGKEVKICVERSFDLVDEGSDLIGALL